MTLLYAWHFVPKTSNSFLEFCCFGEEVRVDLTTLDSDVVKYLPQSGLSSAHGGEGFQVCERYCEGNWEGNSEQDLREIVSETVGGEMVIEDQK